MAYDFTNPAASASDAIQAELLRRVAQQRQAMLDALNTNKINAEIESQKQTTAALDEQRKALAAERDQSRASKVLSVLSPGQEISPETSKMLAGAGYGDLTSTMGGATLPAEVNRPGVIEAPTTAVPSVPDTSVPTYQTFKGTEAQIDKQRQQQRLKDWAQNQPANVQQMVNMGIALGAKPDDIFKTINAAPPKAPTPVQAESLFNPATKNAVSFVDGHYVDTSTGEVVAQPAHYQAPQREPVEDQNKLEQQARNVVMRTFSSRSGGLGLEDQKVNQANHLLALLDQYKGQNMPENLQNELALGLARLVSPNGQVGIELSRELNLPTAQQKLGAIATYFTGNPTLVNASPEAVRKVLEDSIIRQGTVAEQNRQQYLDNMAQMFPASLEQSRVERLKNSIKLNPLRGNAVQKPAQTGTPQADDLLNKYFK